MATGTEHYREAERAIENAKRAEDKRLEPIFLAYAQAHATLATRPSDANLTFTIAGKPVSPEQMQEYTRAIISEANWLIRVLNDHFPDGLPDDLTGAEQSLKRSMRGGIPWPA